MIAALLLAAAQPAPASPPASPPASSPAESIDVTATMEAYLNWRACLDFLLGMPPRARQPKRKVADAAFEKCGSYEAALETAAKAAFGPGKGDELFTKFYTQAQVELNGSPKRR